MTSAEQLNYTEEEIKKFEVEHAKAVVEMHGWKIKSGEIHSDNGTVIDWINKHNKIIEEYKDKQTMEEVCVNIWDIMGIHGNCVTFI